MAYYMIRLIICKLVWNFDMVLDNDDGKWVSDQKIYGTWQKLPLIVRLHPTGRP